MSAQNRKVKSVRSLSACAVVVLVLCCGGASGASAAGGSVERWEHLVDFDPNFRLLWSVEGQEVTFEMQARTLGYVGVGFSKDGTLAGADLVVGWMDDQGHAHLQHEHNNTALKRAGRLGQRASKRAGPGQWPTSADNHDKQTYGRRHTKHDNSLAGSVVDEVARRFVHRFSQSRTTKLKRSKGRWTLVTANEWQTFAEFYRESTNVRLSDAI
ncbi:hypothetical protein ZHAS_00017541 [Anopheles sinensis]|uniref:DOMON domain-containing protein n=1 Tax=Anopheles sinensis TaxID=74873 RepID=A0A084WGU3_ANOSI|nr:hypothetical protein ZHAS_00017541 [Anopheles sinensis]